MSSKTMQFFALPEEFVGMMRDVIESLGLCAVIEEKNTHTKERKYAILSMAELESWIEKSPIGFYLGEQKQMPSSFTGRDFAPSELGLIQVEPPERRERTLLLGAIGAKTGWYDLRTGEERYQQELGKLFDRVKRKIKKEYLHSPVWGFGVSAPDKRTLYRGIGYSSGAAAFFGSGGEWMQRGVMNVRFAPVQENSG